MARHNVLMSWLLLRRSSGSRSEQRSRSRSFTAQRLLMLMIFLIMACIKIEAFLFPDLIYSTGISAGQSRRSIIQYRIGVVVQEPYIYADGTGYVPDLMLALADTFSRLNDDAKLSYEIVPLNSWSELIAKTSRSHKNVAFGLVSPHLLHVDEHYSHLHISKAVVHTSLKLVSKPTSGLPFSITALSRNNSSNQQTKLMMVEGGVEEQMLCDNPMFSSRCQMVNDTHNGVNHVRHHSDSYLVVDSSVFLGSQTSAPDMSLMSICAPKEFQRSVKNLFYGFLSSSARHVKQLDDLVRAMIREDKLRRLNNKYFNQMLMCG